MNGALRPWLVTGASGFLGRHLLQTIAGEPAPHPTIALVRDRSAWNSMDWTARLGDAVRVVETPAEGGAPPLEPLGGIFHLAAVVRHDRRETDELYRANVDGTLAMVRLAATHECRIVFLSTSGTVGCFRRPGAVPDEDAPYCGEEVAAWPYYDSKVKAERAARALATGLGVDLVIVRPPVLLGPEDHRLRSTGHVTRFLKGNLPFVIQGGMHFADVRDVARAIVRIMTLPRARPVYHLPGTICSIAEFYRLTADVAGRKPPALQVPFQVAYALARISRALGSRLLPDPALVEMASRHWAMRSRYAEEELGYRSRPGRETLSDTVDWLRASGVCR
ncbi:MAG: NAD-dependent epimerase/dehydratase family protein [Gemmatimonadales bacterium]